MTERHEVSRSALLAAALLVAGLSVSALSSQRQRPAPQLSRSPVNAGVRSGADADTTATTQARALREGRAVDLNLATVEDLRLLPGIGPMLAARIVAYRARVGPFERVEQLDAVPGIGPKTLGRITPLLTLQAAAPPTSTRAR